MVWRGVEGRRRLTEKLYPRGGDVRNWTGRRSAKGPCDGTDSRRHSRARSRARSSYCLLLPRPVKLFLDPSYTCEQLVLLAAFLELVGDLATRDAVLGVHLLGLALAFTLLRARRVLVVWILELVLRLDNSRLMPEDRLLLLG